MITNKKDRLTSQKKIILNYLKSVKIHPSAQAIFKEVRRKLPRISLATVYRVLKNLKERKEILEISTGISHYDGDLSSQAHFICQKCHKIFDSSDLCKNCHILKHKKIKVGRIKDYQVYFYGNCKKCK